MTSTTPFHQLSKILVPVDGSESSMRAAAAAVALAQRYSGGYKSQDTAPSVDTPPIVQVIAIHIVEVEPKLSLFGKYGFNYDGYAHLATEVAHKATEHWFTKIKEQADSMGVNYKSVLKDNSLQSVVGEIIEYANREHVDLIIVGTRGQSQFTKIVIGSVSLGLLTYAHCPVIIVR